MSFKLDYMLSTLLSSIDEVAKVTDDLLRPPGYPNYVMGMMSRRGEVIMIIDLRSYYGMAPTQDPINSRVLIVKGTNGRFGLLVDAVESIYTVDDTKKVQIPMFLAKDVADTMRGDMNEVVEMMDQIGNKKTFMILDMPELVKRLESLQAA